MDQRHDPPEQSHVALVERQRPVLRREPEEGVRNGESRPVGVEPHRHVGGRECRRQGGHRMRQRCRRRHRSAARRASPAHRSRPPPVRQRLRRCEPPGRYRERRRCACRSDRGLPRSPSENRTPRSRLTPRPEPRARRAATPSAHARTLTRSTRRHCVTAAVLRPRARARPTARVDDPGTQNECTACAVTITAHRTTRRRNLPGHRAPDGRGPARARRPGPDQPRLISRLIWRESGWIRRGEIRCSRYGSTT